LALTELIYATLFDTVQIDLYHAIWLCQRQSLLPRTTKFNLVRGNLYYPL